MSWINIYDIFYPAKTYYLSVEATSPAELFGGNWQKIDGGLCLTTIGDYSWSAYDLTDSNGPMLATEPGSIRGRINIANNQMPAHEGHLYSWGGNCTLYLPQGTLTTYGSTGRGWNIQAGNEAVPAGRSVGGGAPYIPKHCGIYVWRRIS